MDKDALERGMATRRKVMGEAHIARRGTSKERRRARDGGSFQGARVGVSHAAEYALLFRPTQPFDQHRRAQ